LFSITLTLASVTAQSQITPGLDLELRETLDSMRNVLGAKSLSAAIQTADDEIWAHASGISSTAEDATPDHRYLIASVTKTLTAACILQLADEGLLSINDSLHEWLPEMPYIDTNITIRQLLNHTSGIFDVLNHPHHYDSLMADMSRIWTPEELIDRFISPPLFQPGTSWSYCNTNYFILSMIIKEVTGNDFYTELRNRFFDTLSLNSFAIPSFENLNGPVAHCWLDLNGDGVIDDGHSFYMSYMSLNSTAGAAGGYFSTPTDCTKWMRAYMRGDLLSEEMMTEARTTVQVGGNIERYGLGLMRKTNGFLGYEAYGHGGDLAYHAASWYFPLLDQSITVFTNDNTENSWTLVPVVRELLRTYINEQDASIEPEFMSDLKVSPNPFRDQITVSWNSAIDEEISISLKDATGRIIISKTDQPHNKVNQSALAELETLSAGNYFLTISASNGWTKTIKVIK
jgi:D-alanyl-D-alanine carboxypeptidase